MCQKYETRASCVIKDFITMGHGSSSDEVFVNQCYQIGRFIAIFLELVENIFRNFWKGRINIF